MLKKFTITNFRNFNEPITLDFSKVKHYDFNEKCIKNSLINKSIMYGRNAEGKTNLGKALMNIRSILVDERSGYDGNFINGNIDVQSLVTFEYEFIISGKKIEFVYKRDNKEILVSEKLSLEGRVVYDYDHTQNKWNENNLDKFDCVKVIFSKKDKNLSILKYIIYNSEFQKELKILDDFSKFIRGMAAIRYREAHNSDASYFYTGPNSDLPLIKLISENQLDKKIEKLLGQFDLNVTLKLDNENTNDPKLKLKFDHTEFNFFNHASSGTRALTGLYVRLTSEKDISFLFIDEFDAYMHFELAEKLIQDLLNQTIQIIMTTHNTDLMTNKFFRPDCIFIIDSGIISPLYELTKRHLSRIHDLEHLYHAGSFSSSQETIED